MAFMLEGEDGRWKMEDGGSGKEEFAASFQGEGAPVGMGMKSFTELEAWKAAHALTLDVYRRTDTFPPRERFGLSAQMRSAASSIGANLAEGFKRRSWKDKARFYNMAEGSLAEVENFLYLSRDLGYLKDPAPLFRDADRLARLLTGLLQSTLQTADSMERGPR